MEIEKREGERGKKKKRRKKLLSLSSFFLPLRPLRFSSHLDSPRFPLSLPLPSPFPLRSRAYFFPLPFCGGKRKTETTRIGTWRRLRKRKRKEQKTKKAFSILLWRKNTEKEAFPNYETRLALVNFNSSTCAPLNSIYCIEWGKCHRGCM